MVLEKLEQYGWSRSISNLSGSSTEKLLCDIKGSCGTGRCAGIRDCMEKERVSAYGERTESECR